MADQVPAVRGATEQPAGSKKKRHDKIVDKQNETV
jgi:hypothetical protein